MPEAYYIDLVDDLEVEFSLHAAHHNLCKRAGEKNGTFINFAQCEHIQRCNLFVNKKTYNIRRSVNS